ncbi:rhamnulokinase [Cohnella silvisoli]|uniref:FGGY family carbohydrate kinase n=1 Tax=Cohnella silvisoli TaxID=2873699 RepID=A0ABV1KMU4_9BACL|nr:FGGY-family carbohydrate kinase [Cohnella silvisoli]MCD9020261.1 rhamnulokinase [Cohnella silvisoli]
MDLGASNGRGVIGSFDGNSLKLIEAHRFPNGPVSIFSNLYWDTMHLYKELMNSIRAAGRIASSIRSIGIDGWSQDFGLLDKRGNLLGMPRHYRDPRTNNIRDKALAQLSEEELYSITGKTPSQVSTLFQLAAMQDGDQALLGEAHTLLFIPNLLTYYLTREINCDLTLASASSLFNLHERNWSKRIGTAFGFPRIWPEIAEPGRTIGSTLPHVAEQTGLSGIPVISVAQHDTLSALLAAQGNNREDTACIICGTWSVVSLVRSDPVMNREMLAGHFHNEPGYYGDRTHIVKYMTGMWILQECIREWSEDGKNVDYAYLQAGAEASRCESLIDVEHADFAAPGDMSGKIVNYCRKTGQKEPETEFDLYKCIAQGLAAKFAHTIGQLQQLTGQTIKEIHIVGGGSRNSLLCRLTARRSGIPVISQLPEASVIGNALVQLIALGEIGGMSEASAVLERSFQSTTFYP